MQDLAIPVRVLLCATLGRAEIATALTGMPGIELAIAPDSAAVIAALRDHDVLMCPNPIYTEALAAAMRRPGSRVKWLQLLTAGYDTLLEFGTPPGLVVTGAGDAYAPAVAIHAVTLMLALERRLMDCAAGQAARRWDRAMSPKMSIPFGGEIAVVGFGSIGQEVARLVRPMGARIVAVTRSARPTPLADAVAPIGRLDAILPNADAVILALPLAPETRHLMGAAQFARMRRSAVLVNIARGGLVDTDALVAALGNGTIASAGLDVTDPEPLPDGHPLWAAPNLIVTPHVAGACGGLVGARLATIAVENLHRYVRGEPLAHPISL